MTVRTLKMVFVMDPIEDVVVDADTTFVLMLEAQERGHEILYVDQGDIGVSEAGPGALATPVVLRRQQGNHVELGELRFELSSHRCRGA